MYPSSERLTALHCKGWQQRSVHPMEWRARGRICAIACDVNGAACWVIMACGNLWCVQLLRGKLMDSSWRRLELFPRVHQAHWMQLVSTWHA